jgi:hypothetical protein
MAIGGPGGSETRPYRISESKDPVDVIWHEPERIQLQAGVMVRKFVPHFLHSFSQTVR